MYVQRRINLFCSVFRFMIYVYHTLTSNIVLLLHMNYFLQRLCLYVRSFIKRGFHQMSRSPLITGFWSHPYINICQSRLYLILLGCPNIQYSFMVSKYSIFCWNVPIFIILLGCPNIYYSPRVSQYLVIGWNVNIILGCPNTQFFQWLWPHPYINICQWLNLILLGCPNIHYSAWMSQ